MLPFCGIYYIHQFLYAYSKQKSSIWWTVFILCHTVQLEFINKNLQTASSILGSSILVLVKQEGVKTHSALAFDVNESIVCIVVS